ncbi:DotU family type IV/VI secretion system protein [Vibrio vulnificus]|uniref:type IVB secretion system protein IcmH/DotU n=1 Tax=Vibrio vulnificus TaxID=672 RepID=UPI0005F10E87|nr:type IVB secretion system protein IcmH/DotU [Vibrio vulnificus]EGQ7759655.1 DotU family type IV/VI secretion system protein [Vibrio vulnificus]EGQ7963530.1 DotU family type IV/VI secretion system protein [Vibrio vulnificus]EHH2450165.1 DotU family type IV/VI secretion system protein [Vibrio vulnificus]EHU4915525.1 type IVB secretion system protein IcmH/DotU [Vibrio vulnificus]EIY8042398.1 type IVB secretion system protein IcmH/DotU [Vibrio vulnificus]
MQQNKKETPLSNLLFDDVEKINHDQDYWFQLRGDNRNLLIDAATPLFGLSLRVRTLTECDNIDQIYRQTIEEIKAIEIELTEQGYEHSILMAYRYILCAFLDESVMGTEWGASSVWAEHSMLSRFHNETWGGEKVFTILNRLEGEPERYQTLIAFIYHCLVLGFEGKYRVMEGGKAEREKVISRVYRLINDLEESEPQDLTCPTEHVVRSKYILSRQMPVWSVFIGFIVLWIGIFIGYSYMLHSKSSDVLGQLNQIL